MLRTKKVFVIYTLEKIFHTPSTPKMIYTQLTPAKHRQYTISAPAMPLLYTTGVSIAKKMSFFELRFF